jgi:hypothetical protein
MIIAAPIAWYLISPLFITRTVNEDFPVALAAPVDDTTPTAIPPKPTTTIEAQRTPMPTQKPATVATPASATTPTTEMPTPQPTAIVAAKPDSQPPAAKITAPKPTTPSSEPKLLRSGAFHSVTHEGQGTAAIYQLPNGKRVLRLSNFEVLNGPDLFVWLSSAPDANNARTILKSRHVSLGRLKGNKGNQNYDLPADLDVSQFNSVTIWCRQFSVNFATAPLK